MKAISNGGWIRRTAQEGKQEKYPKKKIGWQAEEEMVAGVVVYQRRPLPDPSFRLVIFSLSGFRLLFF